MAALEIGQMTQETESTFLSAVASSIFQYKKIPTKEEYVDAATCIIEKYLFMQETIYIHERIFMQGWIIMGLSNHLKEWRKPHVPKKPHSETQAMTKIENPKDQQ